MKTRLLIPAVFVLTAVAVLAYPLTRAGTRHVVAPVAQPVPAPAATAANGKPRIDAVFVLDTTGSMGGLIQGAKENIWSIASSMAQAKPTPELRIGLVAYRDRGDAYVTRVVDLSSDLDSMFATLMDFQADGGGDTPESVNEALHDAVHKISWSQDKDAYKVIFLVGDAPAHTDYADDVQYPETIAAAMARGVVVNTIQVGNNAGTHEEWQRIASLNQGEYFKVD
ncbi:VWA domain-containing protein [Dokdonella sp.]|uniref:vWA domain-containing protein n=1 Tax=Dokdonella sp. TaxID=2291710 RepID=UPI003527ED6B